MKKSLGIILLLSILCILFVRVDRNYAANPCMVKTSVFTEMDENLPTWSDSYVPCVDSLKWELTFSVCDAPEWGAISACIPGTDVEIDVFSFEYSVDSTYTLSGYARNTSIRNALLVDLVVGPPPGHFKGILFTVIYFKTRFELGK